VSRWLAVLAAVVAAVVLAAAATFAALVGLSAECTGSTTDCPPSDAHRGTLIAMPLLSAVLLVVGAAWSIRRSSVRPLVLAEACVLAVAAVIGSILGGTGIVTIVLLALAFVIGQAAMPKPRG
jgi:hypothetical protein